MLIIAERINAARKRMAAAFAARDAAALQDEARRQAQAGADYIDVNAALSPDAEYDLMAWAVDAVRAATDKPLAVDSANPAAVRAGLQRLPRGSAILNSISGEESRLAAMLPLAAEFQARVIALAMDDSGMPATAADRWRALGKILAATDRAGIPRDRILIDPLVRPVATSPEQAAECLRMIREIRERAGGAGAVVGLSNISFGLPSRRHLNRTFLAMAAAAGLSAAICDPLEPELMAAVLAARCLTGTDAFCMNYILAQRAGKL
ncbi:MAG: methyltetrahydrofolate cobalamin methyltransferase [Planctomycetes bacterium]|nr:methyltetrahydrofolate cobalamin methyltransferase [Planctomycetota bacterium]